MTSCIPLSNHLSSWSKMWTFSSSKSDLSPLSDVQLGSTVLGFQDIGLSSLLDDVSTNLKKSSFLFLKLLRLPWHGQLRTYTDWPAEAHLLSFLLSHAGYHKPSPILTFFVIISFPQLLCCLIPLQISNTMYPSEMQQCCSDLGSETAYCKGTTV